MYNLTTTCRFGGVETFVWEISRELARRGAEVHIIGGRGNILHSLPGLRVWLFPFWRRERVPDLGRRFRKLAERWSMAAFALPSILRQGYDIFHIHKPFDLPVGWMVKKAKGTKLVLGSHGTDFIPGDRLFARKVDVSVSCSRYNSHLIYQRYGIKPEVIYNGIDPRIFHPFRSSDSEIRQKYSVSEGEKVVIYVGRLVGLKGVKVLLRATALIARPGLKLLIVGDGEERNSLAALARSLGIERQVLFAGFVPNSELRRYYSIAEVAVFPSLADEAFGISLCEAMACGVPAVATRVGGIPELQCDGETGFLVSPGDEADLAEKIEALLADEKLRLEMGDRAVHRVREFFTWEKVTDRLQKVYSRALGLAGPKFS